MYSEKNVDNQRKDKTEDVFRLVSDLKNRKIKGKIIMHFDGSGNMPRAEFHRDI